jgi:hypothetical protein
MAMPEHIGDDRDTRAGTDPRYGNRTLRRSARGELGRGKIRASHPDDRRSMLLFDSSILAALQFHQLSMQIVLHLKLPPPRRRRSSTASLLRR